MEPQPARQPERGTPLHFPLLEAASKFRREAATKEMRTAPPPTLWVKGSSLVTCLEPIYAALDDIAALPDA